MNDIQLTNQGLTELSGLPDTVKSLDCSVNQLTSLKGCPQTIRGDFICQNQTALVSFEGSPKYIAGNCNLQENQLSSFDGLQITVMGTFDISYNRFTSLKDIHKHVLGARSICLAGNPLGSNVLGLFLIPGLEYVHVTVNAKNHLHPIQRLINKWLKQGRKGLLGCQMELIENGLEDFAQI